MSCSLPNQHGKAGGCMHTFGERGYVFDTGIHYIGKMMADGINRFLFDQLSDGQVGLEFD